MNVRWIRISAEVQEVGLSVYREGQIQRTKNTLFEWYNNPDTDSSYSILDNRTIINFFVTRLSRMYVSLIGCSVDVFKVVANRKARARLSGRVVIEGEGRHQDSK